MRRNQSFSRAFAEARAIGIPSDQLTEDDKRIECRARHLAHRTFKHDLLAAELTEELKECLVQSAVVSQRR